MFSKNRENYDHSDVFHTQMKPLLEQLHKIALDNHVDFVGLVQYMQSDAGASDTFEAGISKTVALHGPNHCLPSMAAAACCTDDSKAAMLCLMMSAAMGNGSRPDDKGQMLKDGTDEELAGTKDSVESLMAHLAGANPAGKC